DLATQNPEALRAGIKAWLAVLPEPEPVARVDNCAIPGPAGEIPLRNYMRAGEGPFPILVTFRGGGWVICGLGTHDPTCRRLANGAGCMVVSADYRLAPEHKVPSAPEDCYAATRWVAEHTPALNGDPGRSR